MISDLFGGGQVMGKLSYFRPHESFLREFSYLTLIYYPSHAKLYMLCLAGGLPRYCLTMPARSRFGEGRTERV